MNNKNQVEVSGFSSLRQFSRISVLWTGEYVDREGVEQTFTIYNVSINGIMGKIDHKLEVGTHLKIRMAESIQPLCEVIWSNSKATGFKFIESPSYLASIMAGILPADCLQIGHDSNHYLVKEIA